MEVNLQTQTDISFFSIELGLLVVVTGGGMFSLPGKHRVVGLLLFLLVLLTHIQRGQVDSQQLSDTLPAVDVAVLVQNLEEASQVNLPYRLASNGPQNNPPPYLSLDKFVPIVVWEGAVNRD